VSVPAVSIGLPVFNGENYLEEAIQSILNQTFANFELIICDNNSSDNKGSTCRTYEQQDSRIRYYRNDENVGASRNFNQTFELARGPYFKWAAHDDRLAPDFVERCVAVLDADSDLVLCFSRTQVIDGEGRETDRIQVHPLMLSSEPSERFFGHVYFRGHWCYPVFGLIHSDVLAETPLIEPYVTSDRVLLSRLALMGPLREIEEPLFFPRHHSERSIVAMEAHLRASWFDPRKAGKISLPKWRLLKEYVNVIEDVDLSTSQRAACYGVLLRWLADRVPDLADEVKTAVAAFIRKLRRRKMRDDRETAIL